MDTLLQDTRYAVRKLMRTPAFTLIAVATLALAIGATTAIFSVVNGVLLKPLPFKDPERLVMVGSMNRDAKVAPMSPLDFIDYRDQSHSFEGMAAMDGGPVNFTGPDVQPVRLNQARVGARFFSLLGVTPQLGRAFAIGEDAATAPKVVILSDATWRSHFAADPRIVGQTISLDGNPYTVVGVAPPKFSYPTNPDRTDIWTPLQWQPYEVDPGNRGAHYLFAIGRVKPGVPIENARRDLDAVARRLAQQFPKSNTGFGADVVPLQERIVGNVRPALFAMLGSVGFVLLIACANVANLLLVRAASRESEMALRTALGAARGRIVRQLVTESVLLSVTGAVLGAALAAWAVDAVVAFGPRGLPRLDEIAMDGRVLLFTGAIAIATGLLFGLVPALHAARPDLSEMLRASVRASRSGMHRTRAVLVVGEMALAVVLLVGAGLLIRSFVRLTHVDPGFRPDHVVAFSVSLPEAKYRYDRPKRVFAAAITERMKRLPGTEEVAVSMSRPLGNGGQIRTVFDVVGQPPAPPEKRTVTAVMPVSSDYFRTLGITLLQGRVFTAAEDRPSPPGVVLVNQAFVKAYYKNENPIGKRITLGMQHDTAALASDSVTAGGEIVGIVGDVKERSLSGDTYPATYIPFNSNPFNDLSVLVRSSADPSMVETAMRAQMRELDPDLPIYDLSTMNEVAAESVAQPRFYTVLLGAFAGIALLLAVLGIYGVISYTVSQRVRELGIRIALGASRERVIGLVIGSGLALTVTGVAVGIVAAFGLTRLIASLLFGVAAVDPLTFVVVSLVLIGVAALASWIPARRAAQVDPVIAMRAE